MYHRHAHVNMNFWYLEKYLAIIVVGLRVSSRRQALS
jgi:hypothetical protein